jgi:glycosyltransferase involved in cell wall biosynthesis
VDVSAEALNIAQTAVRCTSGIRFFNGDGALEDLPEPEIPYGTVLRPDAWMRFHHISAADFLKTMEGQAGLIYMDHGESGEETARLHEADAKTILERDLVKPGGLVLIDDHGADVPKSKYSLPLFLEAGYRVLAEGYQILLERPLGPEREIPKILHVFPSDDPATDGGPICGKLTWDLPGWEITEWTVKSLDLFFEEEAAEWAEEYFNFKTSQVKLRAGLLAVVAKRGGVGICAGVPQPAQFEDHLIGHRLIFFSQQEETKNLLEIPDALSDGIVASCINHPFWRGMGQHWLAFDVNDQEALDSRFITQRVKDSFRFLELADQPVVLRLKELFESEADWELDATPTEPGEETGKIASLQIRRKRKKRADVIAYTYGPECGLGEAAGMNIEAMEAAGLVVDRRIWAGALVLEPALKNPHQLYYHHWHPQADEIKRDWARLGFKRGAFHVAYWAFEIENALPMEFKNAAPIMSEIWTPSQFCKRIFRETKLPVHVLPHAVPSVDRLRELNSTGGKAPFTVLYLFDAWSRCSRKNPEASIRVFQKAFPHRRDVRLVLKGHHLNEAELKQLRAAAGWDSRITVLNEFLSFEALEQLFANADVLLSLQRSEGFGLNIARALGIGLPVITTGWGGHLDFCKSQNSMLVPYQMKHVSLEGDHFYQEGVWADPDEKAAAKMLREVCLMVESADPVLTKMRKHGLKLMATNFSREALKKRIAERLQALPKSLRLPLIPKTNELE